MKRRRVKLEKEQHKRLKNKCNRTQQNPQLFYCYQCFFKVKKHAGQTKKHAFGHRGGKVV